MTTRYFFRHRRTGISCLLATLLFLVTASAIAHPLGNFTINHFARIESGFSRVQVHYVLDFAEIPTFQEAQTADMDGDGVWSPAELNAWLERQAPGFLAGLKLTADGTPVALRWVSKHISLQPGAANLPVLRVVCELAGEFTAASAVPRFQFENVNYAERAGWRELSVTPLPGATVFNSTLFGNSLTDELKTYPETLLMSPLNERAGEWSATSGALPANGRTLMQRDGQPAAAPRDRFAELITVPELTPGVILLGLLIAFVFGGLHALSPGHGKTVVGAYLVGARGTAKHAAFLGLTVTITHTLGVFALGLVTLFASQYILPERLYPILSFVSGALVVTIGLSLFIRRLRAALGVTAQGHHHPHDHAHPHPHDHAHAHHHHDHASQHEHRHEDLPPGWHSHGGHAHTHLPPGADGAPITWRNLLALGISGGLLPCPSALVLMLAAISLHRVAYGLVLTVAFSLGLASVLTAVGLAFVYAGRLLGEWRSGGRLVRVIPAVSALVITVIGTVICWQAFQQAGVDVSWLWQSELEGTSRTSAAAILGLGLLIGLRHALDTDHLAAVSTIVSERHHWLSSLLVGGLWGIGHTVSLLIAGVAVILLQIRIERYEQPLEFCVALMLIGLGASVLYKLARGGKLHFHEHTHGGHTHVHPHLHEAAEPIDARSHHGLRLGLRPLLVGLVHGLAGSAALMLAVLATIKTPALAFGYIAIFGLGSIGGMMLMSLLLSLPLQLAAAHFTRADAAVRVLAGCFSCGFGLWMVYEIGFVEGFLR